MEKKLNNYLEQIDKYLRPMAVSERIDIVKEIQSEMLELQHNDISPEQIIERLGSPKALAKAYLGETIAKSSGFSWRKLSAVIAFYSLAGLGGMIVLPVTSICGIAFMFAGALCPLAGIIKFAAHLMGHEIPQISIAFNTYTASASAFLPISFLTGIVLFAVGWFFWKLTIFTVRTMSSGKKKLEQL
ncbi:MAG: DUF1700 domain-containing protein [Lachnospiraceae bacterium]|nr:DUF1700 domain-containing protein [Lachnospiraceae bacterium]